MLLCMGTAGNIMAQITVTKVIIRYSYCWLLLHAARANNNWALSIIKWDPIGKRKRGRPKARWTTDVKYCADNWVPAAENRDLWCIKREAFVQQWKL